MLLHAKIYWPEEINKILWPYSLKDFAEKLNVPYVDYDGINPMEKFAGTTTYIPIKNNHTWVFPLYVLDARFKGKITLLPKL